MNFIHMSCCSFSRFKSWKSTLTHDRVSIHTAEQREVCVSISLPVFHVLFSFYIFQHVTPLCIHGTHHTLKVAQPLKGACLG